MPGAGTARKVGEAGGTSSTGEQSDVANADVRTDGRTDTRRTQVPRAVLGVGLLARMRVRKKLIFLHTVFSMFLATILVVALWPAMVRVVERAEAHEARLVVEQTAERLRAASEGDRIVSADALLAELNRQWPDGVSVKRIQRGREVLWPIAGELESGQRGARISRPVRLGDGSIAAVAGDPTDADADLVASVYLADSREGVTRLMLLLLGALLGVYALIAAALELLVLPAHVYEPIGRILAADAALQEGRRDEELIPPAGMPADELGEIMRSRNRSVELLRRHEDELARANAKLESIAADLQRKNDLIELARRNLADADRLASLGMMSAGLAHELNTPLAVIKGLVETQQSRPDGRLQEGEAALLLRVVGRLERLSESLLDFARVRPVPLRLAAVAVADVVDEAWTLVRLDKEARGVNFRNDAPRGLELRCDADRLIQVLVNVLRNGVEAVTEHPTTGEPSLRVSASREVGDGGRGWVRVRVEDNGPGVDPAVLERLFEPFVSTRLDSKGTGLGLAVSAGIVGEHGGRMQAHRAGPAGGSVFDILLPVDGRTSDDPVTDTAADVRSPGGHRPASLPAGRVRS